MLSFLLFFCHHSNSSFFRGIFLESTFQKTLNKHLNTFYLSRNSRISWFLEFFYCPKAIVLRPISIASAIFLIIVLEFSASRSQSRDFRECYAIFPSEIWFRRRSDVLARATEEATNSLNSSSFIFFLVFSLKEKEKLAEALKFGILESNG